MIFHLIPTFEKRAKQIIDGQTGLGIRSEEKGLSKKFKQGVTVLSALTVWSLEGAMVKSEAMRARGYGSPVRSRYSPYRLTKRDWLTGGFFAALFVVVMLGAIKGDGVVTFLPVLSIKTAGLFDGLTFWTYFIFCFYPVFELLWEDLQWRILQSKI